MASDAQCTYQLQLTDGTAFRAMLNLIVSCVWSSRHLRVQSAGRKRPSPFDANLTRALLAS